MPREKTETHMSLMQNPGIGVSSTKQRLGGEGINPSPTRVFVGAGFIPAPFGSEFCRRLI